MKVGGLQPVTLLDYPQKVAAIIFTNGCNMRCPFCHNPDLVLPELINKQAPLPEGEVFDFLKKRKKYLDGLVITGGEPTMQGDIVDFCQKVKKIGYLIKFDTNGLLPEILQELLDKKLLDYIAMDLKGPLQKYEKFCGIKVDIKKIKDSIEKIKNSGLPYEFRSTMVKGLHSKKDVVEMAKTIEGAEKYFLQNFIPPQKTVGSGFEGKSFLHSELEEFASLANKYVIVCSLRDGMI
ncbi:MAG: anaerobic ribonucleoside-triphosphate reductase activating protein [bacterium]